MKRRIDAHVVMEKLVPRITEEYRKIYDIRRIMRAGYFFGRLRGCYVACSG